MSKWSWPGPSMMLQRVKNHTPSKQPSVRIVFGKFFPNRIPVWKELSKLDGPQPSRCGDTGYGRNSDSSSPEKASKDWEPQEMGHKVAQARKTHAWRANDPQARKTRAWRPHGLRGPPETNANNIGHRRKTPSATTHNKPIAEI